MSASGHTLANMVITLAILRVLPMEWFGIIAITSISA